MGNGKYEPWKVKQAEFQGYMRAKMEDFGKAQDNQNKINQDLYSKYSKLNTKVSNILTRIVFIASGIGILFTVIFEFGKSMFGKLMGK